MGQCGAENASGRWDDLCWGKAEEEKRERSLKRKKDPVTIEVTGSFSGPSVHNGFAQNKLLAATHIFNLYIRNMERIIVESDYIPT